MERATRRSVRRPAVFVVVALALVPAAVLALVSALVAAPAPGVPCGTAPLGATSVPPPNFLSQWGGPGSGNGQFDNPRGIAVDITGDVYVVDGGNNRVQKFDPAGRYLTQWGSAGPIPGSADGHLSAPFDVAVFRGDSGSATQYVYVADTLHSRVQKYFPDGTFVQKWGQWGSGPGQFKHPQGIAVAPGGNVYVIDRLNYRIQKFGPGGDFITEWGKHADDGGLFEVPAGIVVDSQDNVYVADYGRGAVLKFSAIGQLLATWSSTGLEDRPWLAPRDVAVDASDRVYVCEEHRVTVFTSSGRTVGQWSLQTDPAETASGGMGIAVAPTGEIFVTDSGGNRVKQYDLKGVADETAPVTTVYGSDDEWHRQPVTLTFAAVDEKGGSGVERTELRRQDELLPVWGPWVEALHGSGPNESEWTFPASSDHSGDGEWLVEYRSVDIAGNVEEAKQVTVRIDTGVPVVTVKPTVPSQNDKVVVTAVQGKRATIAFAVQDRLSPAFKFTGYIYARGNVSDVQVHYASSSWVPRKTTYKWTFNCRLRPGLYGVHLFAEDRAGNVSWRGSAGLLVKKASGGPVRLERRQAAR